MEGGESFVGRMWIQHELHDCACNFWLLSIICETCSPKVLESALHPASAADTNTNGIWRKRFEGRDCEGGMRED